MAGDTVIRPSIIMALKSALEHGDFNRILNTLWQDRSKARGGYYPTGQSDHWWEPRPDEKEVTEEVYDAVQCAYNDLVRALKLAKGERINRE